MKHFILFLFCISLLSCDYFKSKEDHLPVDKMAAVLSDLQMAEIYSTLVSKDTAKNIAPVKNLDSLAHYYRVVLAHHKVSLDELNKSIDWYRSNPDMLDTVYYNIIPRLTLLQRAPAPVVKKVDTVKTPTGPALPQPVVNNAIRTDSTAKKPAKKVQTPTPVKNK